MPLAPEPKPLPGLPIPPDCLTIAVPDGYELRHDPELVYVCRDGKVLFTASAAIPLEALTALLQMKETAS